MKKLTKKQVRSCLNELDLVEKTMPGGPTEVEQCDECLKPLTDKQILKHGAWCSMSCKRRAHQKD